MKNKIKMLAIVFSIFSLIFGCESPQGHRGASQDIQESKKRNVFICEYTVGTNPYKINDSLQVTVKEAWLEKHWAYGKTQAETVLYPTEEYQLCINTTEKDLKGCTIDWSIGLNGDLYLRISSENSLIGDFKTLPPDTIEYKVQKGSELSDNYEKVVIGKFVIIKKK